MKIKLLTAALIVAAAPAAFAQTAAAPAATATPQTPEAWLARMTDMTKNMSAYKDPKVFVPWLNAVTEPSFYTTMGLQMMEPGNWLKFMNSMTQPGVYSNVAQFADPSIYTKWLAASLDPNFYTAVLTQLSDPGKLMRWAMSPLDPKLLQMGMNTLNPNVYMKWLMSPLDPQAMQLMTAPVNPNLYMGWLGATVDPKSYGPTWSGWLSNPAGTIAAPTIDMSAFTNMLAAPTAAIPAMPAGVFNPFDPNAWTKMMPAAPAAAPAAK
jgi:hypothetical protein